MRFFYKFVLASIIFASSAVAKPAVVANADKQAKVTCTNEGRLDHDIGDCQAIHSGDLQSVKDCKAWQQWPGGHYYCVLEGQGLCLPVEALADELTGGECFEGLY